MRRLEAEKAKAELEMKLMNKKMKRKIKVSSTTPIKTGPKKTPLKAKDNRGE